MVCLDGARVDMINETISRIEIMEESQSSVDQIYSKIKQIFQEEIDKLPDANYSQNSKSSGKSAPFWNAELQELWNSRCKSEKAYASFICDSKSPEQMRQKQLLLKHFKLSQNEFDKKYYHQL